MIKKINQAASILGLVLCAVLAYVFWKAGLFDSKEALTSCISRFGWAGPAVFITFQAVQVVIPILPGGLGCLAGVILFGVWKGFWYNYIGICAGSMAAFAIARACGRPLVFGCLPYPAFADQRQRAAINMYGAHGVHLQSPSKFCATTVKPRLYSAMDAGLHSRMMAAYSRQPMRVVPARKQR